MHEMRMAIRDAKRVATTIGFGPRYLHSTGQAHKGGPNNGVFLQITAENARDVPIPGSRASFGVIEVAQALGDFAVLTDRNRRGLRVHIKGDVEKGLSEGFDSVRLSEGYAAIKYHLWGFFNRLLAPIP